MEEERIESNKRAYNARPEETGLQNNLKRSLKTRHMAMIALGGTIGTGLFVASGVALSNGGPGGSLVSYLFAGIMTFFVINAMAEMVTFIPITGSFNAFVGRFVDPALSFVISYVYSYQGLISCANDLVAAGIIMQYWLPKINPIVWTAVSFVIVIIINSFGSKVYGELEFWFALIKVVAIVMFLVVAILVAAGVIGGVKYGFSNWSYGKGAFPNGVGGVFKVYLFASYAYSGVEIIGMTAGESKVPTKDIPKATRTLFWRILLFYILTIFLIGLVVPYDNENLLKTGIKAVAVSPLVLVMKLGGITQAADILNAVILTSVLSAGNTVFFTSPRSLYSLACTGKGWNKWKVVSKRGTPIYALGTCVVVVFALSILSLSGATSVYQWLVSITSVSSIIIWIFILFTQWRFRRGFLIQGYSLDDLPFISAFYPYGQLFSFFFLIFILFAQGYSTFIGGPFDAVGFVQAYLGIPIFLILWLGYKFTIKTKMIPLEEIDYETENYLSLGFENYRKKNNTVKEFFKSLFS
ncbi:hypothetical protein BB560_003317 [Smittium megazygosporum]|uniref:Amino acid permease/ SLC12A domain-containing protein n=1 Tax=Smittium megazygosporum TaxID=133381 RepID=A0A2T9ZCA3_9FUNG|nr:hypothetical protein BB560_003317 [Smittium megazygosporum]